MSVYVAGPPAALRRARRWLQVAGILALVAGVAAVAVPAVASVGIAIFIGWVLVVGGLVMALEAYSMRRRMRIGLPVLIAALALVIGIYLVAFPLTGTLTLTSLLAAWFLGTGALLLLAAWRWRDRAGGAMTAIHGAVSLLLGILIAVNLPSSADWAIGLLVGINLIFWGVRALIAASVLSRALRAESRGSALLSRHRALY